MESTPVPVVRPPEPPVPQTLACMNCGTVLTGEYCTACGQRHEPHVHTLGHFLGEAFESITHADSRLWRTMGHLLVKPGRLTRDFFQGRRASYLPPFRLYLVISLLFFLIVGMPEFKESDPPTAESVASLNEAAANMEKDAATTPGLAYAARAMRKEATEQQAILDRAKSKQATGANPEDTDGVHSDMCDGVTQPPPDAGWRAKTLYGFCQKISHMTGKQLLESVVHNTPRALFVLLPLLALIMKLLYWRPKRYYVEHLLFLVHNHCFVFLAVLAMILIARLTFIRGLIPWIETALSLYVIWYVFRAMRVYYGQSRGWTLGKYVVMGFAYMFTVAWVMAGTVVYSIITL